VYTLLSYCTSLQREEEVYKCHLALLFYAQEYINILLPPFLVTGFQAFQLVRAFQTTLHWPAANSDMMEC